MTQNFGDADYLEFLGIDNKVAPGGPHLAATTSKKFELVVW